MRDDRLSDRRHARTILRPSDASDLYLLSGDYPSRVCPPPRVERVAGEGIKNAVVMRYDRLSDRRHARNNLPQSYD